MNRELTLFDAMQTSRTTVNPEMTENMMDDRVRLVLLDLMRNASRSTGVLNTPSMTEPLREELVKAVYGNMGHSSIAAGVRADEYIAREFGSGEVDAPPSLTDNFSNMIHGM